MDLLLQIWGGSFYLVNKVLFALAEGRNKTIRRKFLLWAWGIYILGVPAWVILLISEQNWIAASIEAGGLPSMLLGLYTIYKSNLRPPSIGDKIASLCTYSAIIIGVGYSLFEHGGVSSFNQVLELGVMIGFLLGSYLLAKGDNRGWLFFMLMNVSMASLMLIQGKPLLSIQQVTSLGFVVYGFYASQKKRSHITR